MLKSTCCSICLSINKRTINIYKTDLHIAYENLINYRISDDECWMCYICYTRLRQCHQLQQLAVQTRGLIQDIFHNKMELREFGSLLELSTSRTNINSITEPYLYVKQEPGVKNDFCSDVAIEQNTILGNVFTKEEQPITVSQEAIAGIKLELSDTDNVDYEHLKSNFVEINVGNLGQSVVDEYHNHCPTINSAIDVWGVHEHWGEQSMHAEIKQEIEAKIGEEGNKQDEQHNTNYIVERNITNEAQSGYKDPLTCEVCSKKFSCKSELKVHTRSHTGEKPFNCDICSKKFTRKSSLNTHRQIHTGAVKSFVCDVCAKKFSQKRLLKVHLVTHTGNKMFSCDVCSKKFLRKFDINRHYLTHTGQKPYSCDVCSRKFSRNSDLNVHKRVHNGY